MKAALQSTAQQQIPGAYQDIAKAMNTRALTQGTAGGGANPGSGLALNNYGQLLSQEELAKSNALNQITSQGQNNIFQGQMGNLQAAGITSGVGSNALGSATNAANSATQGSTGILGVLGGAGIAAAGGSKWLTG